MADRYKSETNSQQNLSIIQEFQNLGYIYQSMIPIVNQYHEKILYDEDNEGTKILRYSAPNKPIQYYNRYLEYTPWTSLNGNTYTGEGLSNILLYYHPFTEPITLLNQAMLQKLGVMVIKPNQTIVAAVYFGGEDGVPSVSAWGNPNWSSLEASRPAEDVDYTHEYLNDPGELDSITWHPQKYFDAYFGNYLIGVISLDYISNYQATAPFELELFYKHPDYFFGSTKTAQRQSIIGWYLQRWNPDSRNHTLAFTNNEWLAGSNFVSSGGSFIIPDGTLELQFNDYIHQINYSHGLYHRVPGKASEDLNIELYSWKKHLQRIFIGEIIYNKGQIDEYHTYKYRIKVTWNIENVGNFIATEYDLYYFLSGAGESISMNYSGSIESEVADIVSDINKLDLSNYPTGEIIVSLFGG